MADTYEGLKSEVAQYLGRDDLAELIPGFIEKAEKVMNRNLRLKLMEKVSYTYLVARQKVLALPDRRVPGDWDVFLEMRDIRLNGKTLDNLDYIGVDSVPASKERGKPFGYTIHGRELVLVPTPDYAYEIMMSYYAEIPPLSADQPTNPVLLSAPDMYLYGALLESAAYARSTVPLELWGTFYKEAADSLNKSDESGRFTANITSRPPRRWQ